MIDKKQMTEEDIKLRYITPAIIAKWPVEQITMETKITDGKISLKGNLAFRESPKKADYILYINKDNPIAVVEAKDNKRIASFGLQQAMTYAQMIDVPFAYSSNGDAFFEHDFLTGKEREIALADFPGPDDLLSRYNAAKNPTDKEKDIFNQPYYTSQTTYAPRYYQRNAINRTVDAIAKGQDRILLAMATGERVIIVTGCINALRSRVSETLVNMIHAFLRVIKYNDCKQCMRSKDVLALQY